MSLEGQLNRQFSQPERPKAPLPRKNASPGRRAMPGPAQQVATKPKRIVKAKPKPRSVTSRENAPNAVRHAGLNAAQVALLQHLAAGVGKNALGARVKDLVPGTNDPGYLTGNAVDRALARREFAAAPKDKWNVTLDQALPGPSVVTNKGSSRPAKDVLQRFLTPKPSSNTQQDSIIAPALKVLNELSRPAHALAGAELGAIKSKGDPAAIAEGLYQGGVKNKPIGFADVLKAAGVPKGATRTLGGAAVDLATNPLNFVTGDTAGVAESVASRTATRVAAKAVKKGLKPEVAKRLGETAGRLAAAKAPKGRGAVIKVAGRSVPGVTRATAAVGRRAKNVSRTRPARPAANVGSAVKGGVSEVSPFVRPPGATHAQAYAAEEAARTARATRNTGLAAAEAKAKGLARRLKPEEHQAVIDALEAGNLSRLPKHLTDVTRHADGSVRSIGVARELRDTMRHILRQQRAAGVPLADITKSTTVKGYFPHEKLPTNPEEAVKVGGGVGVKRVAPAAGKARSIKEPLATIRQKTPGLFDENVPTVYANALRNAANAVAQGTLHRNLAKIGRTVRPGKRFEYHPVSQGGTDAVYRLYAEGTSGQKASRLIELDDKAVQRLGEGKAPNGQYFVANKALVEKALATAGQPVGRDSTLLKGVDRATGGWKRLATLSPGFNTRNFVGDTEMAYRNTPARLLPRNMTRSWRTVKARNRFERSQAKGETPPLRRTNRPSRVLGLTPKPRTAGYKVPGEGFKTYEDLAKEASSAGAMRAGYVGRELTDLQHRAIQEGKSGVEVKVKPSLTTRALKGAKLKKLAAKQPAPGKRLNRYLQNREDVPRGATYAHYRSLGFSKDTASRIANREHIDYGNLTPAEKNVFRRVFPFYTFTARNIPNVARTLLQRPGKFSNYELLRENAAKAMGLPANYEGDLTEGEQRQIGVPVDLRAIGLGKVNLSESLPLVDLNEIPTTLNPAEYMTELAHKAWSLLNPGLKIPTELLANYNDYFRSAIQDPHHPLTPAPAWVGLLPDSVKKAFGVVSDYKGKQGAWAWDAKAQYIVSGLNPGLLNAANNILSQGNAKAQSLPQKLLGTPSFGTKATPLGPQSAKAKLDSLYNQAGSVTEQIAALGQRGINHGNDPKGEWRKLRQKQKQLQTAIYNTSKTAGVKLPRSGGPPKPRKPRKIRRRSSDSTFEAPSSSSGSSSSGGVFEPAGSSSSSGSSPNDVFEP